MEPVFEEPSRIFEVDINVNIDASFNCKSIKIYDIERRKAVFSLPDYAKNLTTHLNFLIYFYFFSDIITFSHKKWESTTTIFLKFCLLC